MNEKSVRSVIHPVTACRIFCLFFSDIGIQDLSPNAMFEMQFTWVLHRDFGAALLVDVARTVPHPLERGTVVFTQGHTIVHSVGCTRSLAGCAYSTLPL